jgi:glycosyltransferase involved in cell wall biosynthesis
MKLLISAYACAPNRGSDHAVGWNWATEAHKLGHEVWTFVSPNHRESIKRACDRDPDLAGIRWVFPEVKGWPLKQGIEPKWERAYNLLWQRAAVPHAIELHRKVGFDLVHHLTWAGIRAPTFLGKLPVPLIIGPIGGGETSPHSLRDAIGLKGKILETIRDLSSATIAMNPTVRPGLNRASTIFVSTADTQNLFTGALRKKTKVFSQLGLPSLPKDRSRHVSPGAPRLLYAGRLLYWKGVHIAIRAFAEVVKQHPDAQFTIVGSGPERSRLQEEVARHNLAVGFIQTIPQEQLFDLYRDHDLLIFPSLHDSGGFVVLEALAHGLPVVCLDLGGPKEIVTPDSGVVIKNGNQGTDQVASAMAKEISLLLASPDRISALSKGAVLRAEEFILSHRIQQLYDHVADSVIE